MSIPFDYINNVKGYVRDSLEFLKINQWLYNYPNTHILVNGILGEFTKDWLPHFKGLTNEELNRLALGKSSSNFPDSLKQFLDQIQRLKPSIKTRVELISHNFSNNAGLSNKKRHEILALAPLINKVCDETSSKLIIDIGAGLGYLPQLLYEKYQYRVLAIEGDPNKVAIAKKNQRQKYPDSIIGNSVRYVEHFITENSSESLSELLNEFDSELTSTTVARACCITGLHACADLSITILELFTQLEFAKSLVIMPCCYHRLQMLANDDDDGREIFKYFPVSNLMKLLFDEFDASRFMRKPFLRLACQQTIYSFSEMSYEDHQIHAQNLLYRAILQDVAEQEKYVVKRLKRKTGGKSKQSSSIVNFEDYLSNLRHSHVLISIETKDDEEKREITFDEAFLNKMRDKFAQHQSDCCLFEVLTGLQATIQCICENIILLDRVEFLSEKGLKCVVEQVTDDRVSPRCYALVATKL